MPWESSTDNSSSLSAHSLLQCIIVLAFKLYQRYFKAIITNHEFHRRYKAGDRDFRRLRFDAVDLKGIDLSSLSVQDSDLRFAINLRQAGLAGGDFSRVDFRGVNLSEMDLTYACFKKANLEGANVSGSTLEASNLSYTKLRSANLPQAKCRWANFSHAVLKDANCSGAVFSGANLSRATLVGANLSDVLLDESNLAEADFSSANLTWADLSGAEVSGARFTHLDRTDLKATTIGGVQLGSGERVGSKSARRAISSNATLWKIFRGDYSKKSE